MRELNLKFLNADSNNSIAFLPYGVTTIEFSAEDNDVLGHIRPKESSLGSDNKEYVGFADGTKDFLVVWGAGKESGQYVDSDPNRRMFLQMIHRGNNCDNEKITFIHSKNYAWEQEVRISPASSDDIVRMNIGENGESRRITFKGSKLPAYYPRWFPPRPTSGEKIKYEDLEYPEISIEYVGDDMGVNSPISIFLQVEGQKKKIGSVSGGLNYSYPHAEIFSLLPDEKIFVLRLWFYWIHKRFDGGILYTIGGTDEPRSDDRVLGQKMLNEIPDMERFDFVIDVKKGKIIWYGTDFHYQEYWGSVKDDVVDAKIAHNHDLIFRSLSMLPLRFNPPNNYNPMESLKLIILGKSEESESLDLSLEDDARGEEQIRALNILTHVPYVNPSRIDKTLISSIISS